MLTVAIYNMFVVTIKYCEGTSFVRG